MFACVYQQNKGNRDSQQESKAFHVINLLLGHSITTWTKRGGGGGEGVSRKSQVEEGGHVTSGRYISIFVHSRWVEGSKLGKIWSTQLLNALLLHLDIDGRQPESPLTLCVTFFPVFFCFFLSLICTRKSQQTIFGRKPQNNFCLCVRRLQKKVNSLVHFLSASQVWQLQHDLFAANK